MSSNIINKKNFKYPFLESTAFNECGYVIETVLLPKICKPNSDLSHLTLLIVDQNSTKSGDCYITVYIVHQMVAI